MIFQQLLKSLAKSKNRCLTSPVGPKEPMVVTSRRKPNRARPPGIGSNWAMGQWANGPMGMKIGEKHQFFETRKRIYPSGYD